MKNFLCLLFLLSCTYASAQYDSLAWDNLNRSYLLHLPETYNPSEEIPLVIAMHGGFGNAFNLQNQSQLSVKADEENFIVVYPEGLEGGVFNIRTWNAGWCCGHASATDVDDLGFVNTLLDTLIENYAVDTQRIYATGMSNGGFMSYRLACELSDRIAAIAPVAASMSMVNCSPSNPVPVLDFHSYLDTNVPYLGGLGTGPSTHYSPPLDSVLNVWSEINACEISNDTLAHNDQYTHIQWSTCSCNFLVEQIITTDGGHSWPGGQATPLGDPTSEFVHANDVMWSFFENFTLDCPPTSSTQQPTSTRVSFYPNPTTNTIYIETTNSNVSMQLTVFDTFGKLVMNKQTSTELDVSHLKQGTYILRIDLEDESFLEKFVKL